MPAAPPSHPDRHAATLVQIDPAAAATGCAAPGAGARDCRIDLKLLQWRARAACRRSDAARTHLARWPEKRHPDLWAGTVRDGVARGFAVALEEALALAGESPGEAGGQPAVDGRRTVGKELRRRKELTIASRCATVRFARKTGLSLCDPAGLVLSANFLCFEARVDRGTLDGFAADPAERPRLFSPQFLAPLEFVESDTGTDLTLAGRLGRGPVGWPCRLRISGRPGDDDVRLHVAIENRRPGWRLRARFRGIQPAAIHHECTDVREVVASDAGGFVAFTLVRSCSILLVDERPADVPMAACIGPLSHEFRLGGAPSTSG